jgi:hypothetical protein
MKHSQTLPSAKGFFDKLLAKLNSVSRWCRTRRLRKRFFFKDFYFLDGCYVGVHSKLCPEFLCTIRKPEILRGFSDRLKNLALNLNCEHSKIAYSFVRDRALLLSNSIFYRHRFHTFILPNPLHSQYHSLLNSFLFYSHASPIFFLL